MSSIHDDVKKSFDLASLRSVAKRDLNGKDWEDYAKIRKNIEAEKRFERRDYQLNYKPRVEAEHKRLIDQAGAKKRRFNAPWARDDTFNPAAIQKQAQRNVRHAHMQAIARVEKREADAIDGLLERSAPERALREKTKQDFASATNRRDGEERRTRRQIRTRD